MIRENRVRRQTIKGYKREKLNLLKQLGFHNVDISIFAKATNEIQVDNIAHSIIVR